MFLAAWPRTTRCITMTLLRAMPLLGYACSSVSVSSRFWNICDVE